MKSFHLPLTTTVTESVADGLFCHVNVKEVCRAACTHSVALSKVRILFTTCFLALSSSKNLFASTNIGQVHLVDLCILTHFNLPYLMFCLFLMSTLQLLFLFCIKFELLCTFKILLNFLAITSLLLFPISTFSSLLTEIQCLFHSPPTVGVST